MYRTTWWLSLLQRNGIGVGNLVKPRQIVRGANPRTPTWHNITQRNNVLLPLRSRLMTKLICRKVRWLAWNPLYMAKMPQHHL